MNRFEIQKKTKHSDQEGVRLWIPKEKLKPGRTERRFCSSPMVNQKYEGEKGWIEDNLESKTARFFVIKYI